MVDKFGFNDKNIVAKIALLPIAFYLSKIQQKNYVESSSAADVKDQLIIQKWIVISLLKNSFGGSSDTILKNLQEVINSKPQLTDFPCHDMFARLNVVPSFSETEIENLLMTAYSSKYSYLILSLLYQDRDWKGSKFEEDHIFPKSEFSSAKLRQRGYDKERIERYQKYFNCVLNLELLSTTENREKSAQDFSSWISSRDDNFKNRHLIPIVSSYSFDHFCEFIDERRKLLVNRLSAFSM